MQRIYFSRLSSQWSAQSLVRGKHKETRCCLSCIRLVKGMELYHCICSSNVRLGCEDGERVPLPCCHLFSKKECFDGGYTPRLFQYKQKKGTLPRAASSEVLEGKARLKGCHQRASSSQSSGWREQASPGNSWFFFFFFFIVSCGDSEFQDILAPRQGYKWEINK